MNDNLMKNKDNHMSPIHHLSPVFLNKEDDLLEMQNDEFLDQKQSTKKNHEIERIALEETQFLLPIKVPYSTYSIQMNKNIPHNLDPELTAILCSLFEKMGEKLVIFDKDSIRNFSFKLPPTLFSEKWPISKTNNKRSQADDKLQEQFDQNRQKKVRGLSTRHIYEIWQMACFNTPSPLPDHDFTWELNGWIFTGREKIIGRLYDFLAFSIDQIYEIPNRFYEEKNRMIFWLPNVWSGVYSIYRFFMNIVSLFMGYPKNVFKGVSSKKLKVFMIMQHMEKILQNVNIDKTFHLWMDSSHQNKKILLDIQRDFEIFWKERKDALSAQFAVDDENYHQNVQDLFYQHFYEFINNSNKMSNDNKKLLINLLKAAVIINKSEFFHKKQAEKKINEFTENIKINHNFLNKVERWKENKLKNLDISVKSTYKKAILDESNLSLVQNVVNSSFIILLTLYNEFSLKFNENLKLLKKKEKNRLKKNEENLAPYRTIEIKRYFYPPGQVIKFDDGKYYLEEYTENLVETTVFGWRWIVMLHRYWNWANNVTLFLFHTAINGQYGMKALIYTSEFYTNLKVNPETGEKRNSGEPTETVISTFKKIMESIRKSRRDFENSPDTGIFGKKFTRVCNLFENYVYKFFILGVLLDLIIFPLVIFLNSLFCIVFASTAYVWVFFVVLIFWFINILFYDFDNEGDPLEDASNSALEFPFFFEIIGTFLVFGLIQILLSLIFVILIYPLLMIGAIILGGLYYFFATVYDCFMIVIIYILGREPQSDTIIAWKISGPGVTLDYFNQVELEDIFVSIRAYLENFELVIFNRKIMRMIEEPKQNLENLYQQIFAKSFGVSKPDLPKELLQIQMFLVDKLKNQISCRQNNFPKTPKKVRLSSEELEIVLSSGEKLIGDFVLSRKFDLIWKHFNLKKDEWRQLTKAILSQIFSEDILEPLEELDKRVKLKAKQSNYYDKILEVLKGENADTYKNLILKKKEKIKEINYSDVAPYVKLEQLIECDNYLQSFVNSLYIFTNLESMQNVMIKEEKKENKE